MHYALKQLMGYNYMKEDSIHAGGKNNLYNQNTLNISQ